MIVDGRFEFAGPRATVWELLQDPAVLVKALPGCRRLVRSGADHFDGVMRVGVGPVTAAEFAVTVTLTHKVAPERFAMQVEGQGAIGFTRGTAEVELAERPADGTTMSYHADVQVGGKIAGVGQRLLDQVAQLMTRQGLEAVNRELQARLARDGAP